MQTTISSSVHSTIAGTSDRSADRNGGSTVVRPRQHSLLLALFVAALANALIPAAFFSNTKLFGHIDPRHRSLVAVLVVVEYAVAFLLLRLHANVGFASGYAVATAAIVTVVSGLLAPLTVLTASWSRDAIYPEVFILGWFAIAFLWNVAFLVVSARYAFITHPRLHVGGFLLGIAASAALAFLYIRIIP